MYLSQGITSLMGRNAFTSNKPHDSWVHIEYEVGWSPGSIWTQHKTE